MEHQPVSQQREEDRDSDPEEPTVENNLQDTLNEEDCEVRRKRGRPKLLKTGQPGRQKKIYQTYDPRTPDPESASEALNRDDSEA